MGGKVHYMKTGMSFCNYPTCGNSSCVSTNQLLIGKTVVKSCCQTGFEQDG